MFGAFLRFPVDVKVEIQVEGRFTRVRGTVETTEDGQLKAIEAFIPAASVDTDVSERDTHLRSPDFLDAAKYPELTFRTTTVQPLGGGRYRVRGEITIRDRTHGTVFQIDASPPVNDGQGRRRARATAIGRFSRREWGLAWDRILRFGGLLVADEVDFSLNIEAVASPLLIRPGRRVAPGLPGISRLSPAPYRDFGPSVPWSVDPMPKSVLQPILSLSCRV